MTVSVIFFAEILRFLYSPIESSFQKMSKSSQLHFGLIEMQFLICVLFVIKILSANACCENIFNNCIEKECSRDENDACFGRWVNLMHLLDSLEESLFITPSRVQTQFCQWYLILFIARDSKHPNDCFSSCWTLLGSVP